MIDKTVLKNEEKAIYQLRSLYKQYGYLPFKMSKFEEYDLYVKNKDFLISDRVITFNDTNGKLLALKPDVTLSIIKNGEDEPGCKQKVYYNENVYRVSGSTHQYKEIMQTGLECIGDIDFYDIFESVLLSAKSLDLISSDFVLDISHLGLLDALLDEISNDKSFRREITQCISEKNSHDIERICAEYGIASDSAKTLCDFVSIYGDMKSVTEKLSPLCKSEKSQTALAELKLLSDLLADTSFADKIRFDFSVVNDMSYYNGIVFKGFLQGICESVLSGGQYDNLMHRMGRKSGAVGFALYLDLLEELEVNRTEYDVDVLLICKKDCNIGLVVKTANDLVKQGKSVSVQREIPEKLRYRELIEINEEGKKC